MPMITEVKPLTETLDKAIFDALTERVKLLKENFIKQAVVDFEKQVREEVALATIDITQYYCVERIGTDLCIRVLHMGKQ